MPYHIISYTVLSCVITGHPFLVEAAVSIGGTQVREGINVYRFANRIPLLFETGIRSFIQQYVRDLSLLSCLFLSLFLFLQLLFLFCHIFYYFVIFKIFYLLLPTPFYICSYLFQSLLFLPTFLHLLLPLSIPSLPSFLPSYICSYLFQSLLFLPSYLPTSAPTSFNPFSSFLPSFLLFLP